MFSQKRKPNLVRDHCPAVPSHHFCC